MEPNLQTLLISYEFFEELTGVSLDEIKYGLTAEDKKDINEEDIQKLRKSFNFESALKKARLEKGKSLSLLKRGSDLIFFILFSILFLALLIQIPLWIIDFFFKSNLSNYKFPIVNIPTYYVAIPLGIWIGSGTSITSHTNSKENRVIKAERLESIVKLRKLFVECENYNRVIKSIELKDKISNVLEHGNDPLRVDVIKTLSKIHNNLVKALKIERLLRENLDVVNIETEYLEITFAEIQFTDIKKRASQYSEFVDEVLTIGTNLNREFKMLDNSTNS